MIAYDINGRVVDNLLNSYQIAGSHSFNWNATNYSTGIYIIQVKNKDSFLTQKIMLIK